MCGFIHSTFLIVPVKVIGLFWSNSAVLAWCARSGAAPASQTAPITHRIAPFRVMTFLPRLAALGLVLVVLGHLPHFDRAAEEILEIVLLARVFHDDVGIILDSPRSNVHPVACVRLRIVDRHR